MKKCKNICNVIMFNIYYILKVISICNIYFGGEIPVLFFTCRHVTPSFFSSPLGKWNVKKSTANQNKKANTFISKQKKQPVYNGTNTSLLTIKCLVKRVKFELRVQIYYLGEKINSSWLMGGGQTFLIDIILWCAFSKANFGSIYILCPYLRKQHSTWGH